MFQCSRCYTNYLFLSSWWCLFVCFYYVYFDLTFLDVVRWFFINLSSHCLVTSWMKWSMAMKFVLYLMICTVSLIKVRMLWFMNSRLICQYMLYLLVAQAFSITKQLNNPIAVQSQNSNGIVSITFTCRSFGRHPYQQRLTTVSFFLIQRSSWGLRAMLRGPTAAT